MLDALFQIIIYPIYMALESSFYALYTTLNSNICLTILLISYMVFIFCLPLYLNAARLQHEEESIQAKMAKRVESIKKNFSGDEKHLLLQTYYRQNNYHPVMALRLSFSLLLQIPFFFAAYLFFSHLQIFSETALLHVASLAEPDRMIKLGGITINLMPIVMTIVNITAAYVYTEDKSFKKNAQLYIMSLIFLVLLYNSPSGLVLYWTFNNVFSLIKNLGLRGMGEKIFVRCVFASALVIYYLIAKIYYLSLDIIISIMALIILAPHLKKVGDYLRNFNPKWVYFMTVSALWLLTGLLIPSGVVATSPVEFTFLKTGTSPFDILNAPALQAFGLFVFWGGCFFTLSSDKTRKVMSFAGLLLLAFGLLNAFLIPLPDCNLLSSLRFDSDSTYFAMPEESVYPVCMLFVIILISVLFLFARKILQNLLIIVLSAFIILIGINYVKIYKGYRAYKAAYSIESYDKTNSFNFSTDSKNVLIIFLDRALSSYLPLIFSEKPELKDEFLGFVYYPNTVSMAGYTFLGYQAITGGYEYTPLSMTADTGRTVIEKYVEGLGVLPALFVQNGWETTVADAPGDDWNYDWLKTDEIYTARGVNYKKVRGNLGTEYTAKNDLDVTNTRVIMRNFLYYSFMTVSLPRTRNYIYNKGRYLNTNLIDYQSSFALENYAELYYLPQLTGISKSSKNSFILINNELTHEQGLLYGPDYTFDESLGRPEDVHGFLNNDNALKHYHVNAAALIMVGKYMQFLKDNGVYDNTRIIIVSDHGRDVQNPTFSSFANKYIMPYNPLLLIKDFNSKGEFRSSDEFMTNADVPYLAAKGLIKDIRNPFTGKKITMNNKKNGVYIKTGHSWQPSNYEGKFNPFEAGDTLHFVKDNIFDKKNWKTEIPYKKLKFMIK